MPPILAQAPGTYALAVHCSRRHRLAVGALGTFQINAGFYLYVGSAFGPGGVRSRLLRHLANTGSLHWHIDFLRQVATPSYVWITFDQTKREHEWASALAQWNGVSMPIPRFGASDCCCFSHLFYSEKSWSLEGVRRLLESSARVSAEVHGFALSGPFP